MIASLESLFINSGFVILRLGGCVIIALECKFVILNPSHVILSVAKNLVVKLRTGSVKNLIRSMCYKTEILRLGPQNDIATQPLDQGIQKPLERLDSPIESGNDEISKT